VPRAPEVLEDLAEVVRRMVDEPAEVEIADVWEDDRTCVFELSVAPGDLGKVIGRQGRTARSLRVLLDARGAHEGVDYGLEILDD
jgi:uncharacterized protein